MRLKGKVAIVTGGGVIINIASTAGVLATAAGIEYTAAKHAVVAFLASDDASFIDGSILAVDGGDSIF